MRQALFGRFLEKAIFRWVDGAAGRHIGLGQTRFRDPPPPGRKLVGVPETSRAKPVASWGIPAACVAIAAAVLSASPCHLASAAALQPGTAEPVAGGGPIALYVTICLWSEEHPGVVCNEVSLTPGPAGPVFASMQACLDGQDDAMGRWREEVGPVMGFTAMAGDGYRIEKQRCGPAIKSSQIDG